MDFPSFNPSEVGLSSILGILDPTFDLTVAKYGVPSQNMDNMQNYPDFNPVQQWEMWLHKPEPQVVYEPRLSGLLDRFDKIDSTLQSILNSLMPKLSSFVEGAENK
jgi:nitrate reductase beta subunit